MGTISDSLRDELDAQMSAIIGTPYDDLGGAVKDGLFTAFGNAIENLGWGGAGIPAGGTTDQVLAKSSNNDFEVYWKDCDCGPPAGGANGAVLISDGAGGAQWTSAPSDGQVLVWNAGTTSWVNSTIVQSVAGKSGAVSLVAADVSGVETSGTAAALLLAHEQATDPHPTYTTVAEAAAAAPVQTVAGRTGAVVLAVGDVSGAEATTNRGQANGYAGLDANSRVLDSVLGTGSPGNANWLRGDRTWAAPTAAQVGASPSLLATQRTRNADIQLDNPTAVDFNVSQFTGGLSYANPAFTVDNGQGGTYAVTLRGNFQLISGTGSTNVQLALQKWNGSQWITLIQYAGETTFSNVGGSRGITVIGLIAMSVGDQFRALAQKTSGNGVVKLVANTATILFDKRS